MCNLYKVRTTAQEMARLFDAIPDPMNQIAVEKDYVAPGKPGHVVREEGGQRLLSSPFWKSALANPARRCLVPVTEFQEWSVAPMPDTGKKKAFWFSVPSQPVFAFAGIWRPTDSVPVYSFLTCGYDGDPANHVVGAIHPKACPVVLHEEDYDRWLHTDLEDAISLASPFPNQLMAVA
jgi:putative SOS response-associated peptidase YedK